MESLPQHKYRKYVSSLFQDITALGSFLFFCLLLLSALIFQKFHLFYQLLFGFLFTLAIVILIRSFYFKDRPRKQPHHTFIEKLDASSFPSLHTARALFLALTFTYFFNNKLLTIFLLALTALVAYSRIHLKKHYWLDLLGGLILGAIAFWLSGWV